MIENLIRHQNIISIVGNIITVHVSHAKGSQGVTTRFGDLARVEDTNGSQSLAQVIKIKGNEVSLQIFSGSTRYFHSCIGSFFRPFDASNVFQQYSRTYF